MNYSSNSCFILFSLLLLLLPFIYSLPTSSLNNNNRTVIQELVPFQDVQTEPFLSYISQDKFSIVQYPGALTEKNWVFNDQGRLITSAQRYHKKQLMFIDSKQYIVVDVEGTIFYDPYLFRPDDEPRPPANTTRELKHIEKSQYFVDNSQNITHFLALPSTEADDCYFVVVGSKSSTLAVFNLQLTTLQLIPSKYFNNGIIVKVVQQMGTHLLLILTDSGDLFQMDPLDGEASESIHQIDTSQWFNGKFFGAKVMSIADGIALNSEQQVCTFQPETITQCQWIPPRFFDNSNVTFISDQFIVNTNNQLFALEESWAWHGRCFLDLQPNPKGILEENQTERFMPQLVAWLDQPIQFIDTTSAHLGNGMVRFAMRDTFGQVYSWGYGRNFMLGDAQNCDRAFPVAIDNARFSNIASRFAGFFFSLVFSFALVVIAFLLYRKNTHYSRLSIYCYVIIVVLSMTNVVASVVEVNRTFWFSKSADGSNMYQGGFYAFLVLVVTVMQVFLLSLGLLGLIYRNSKYLIQAGFKPILLVIVLYTSYWFISVFFVVMQVVIPQYVFARHITLQDCISMVQVGLSCILCFAIVHVLNWGRPTLASLQAEYDNLEEEQQEATKLLE